jgi:hypothetical protein
MYIEEEKSSFFLIKNKYIYNMWKKNQRHILIVCALGQELQIVRSILKWQIFQWIQFHYYVCGVGLEKSMISLSEYFSQLELSFELVINIWIVWYVNNTDNNSLLQKWDLVQCLRIIQWDANKELCVPPQYVIPDIDIVALTSRYRLVRDPSKLEWFLDYCNRLVVDMEWYSVESVCDYFEYPRMFLKVIYDNIGQDDLKEYHKMLETMKTSLWVLPELLRKIL